MLSLLLAQQILQHCQSETPWVLPSASPDTRDSPAWPGKLFEAHHTIKAHSLLLAGTTRAQPLSESQVKVTSYDDHYCSKPVGRYTRTLRPAQPMTVPLDGRTTYE